MLILHIKYAYVKMKIEDDSIMIGITVTCEICVILEDRWPSYLWKWKSSQGNLFYAVLLQILKNIETKFIFDRFFGFRQNLELSDLQSGEKQICANCFYHQIAIRVDFSIFFLRE